MAANAAPFGIKYIAAGVVALLGLVGGGVYYTGVVPEFSRPGAVVEPSPDIASAPEPQPQTAAPEPSIPASAPSSDTESTAEITAPVADEAVTEPAPDIRKTAEAQADLPAPAFDLVRVEPDGSAVVAGSAAPGALIRFFLDGVEVGTAETGSDGTFAGFLFLEIGQKASMLTMDSLLGDQVVASAEDIILAPVVAASEPAPNTVELAEASAEPQASPDAVVETVKDTFAESAQEPPAEPATQNLAEQDAAPTPEAPDLPAPETVAEETSDVPPEDPVAENTVIALADSAVGQAAPTVTEPESPASEAAGTGSPAVADDPVAQAAATAIADEPTISAQSTDEPASLRDGEPAEVASAPEPVAPAAEQAEPIIAADSAAAPAEAGTTSAIAKAPEPQPQPQPVAETPAETVAAADQALATDVPQAAFSTARNEAAEQAGATNAGAASGDAANLGIDAANQSEQAASAVAENDAQKLSDLQVAALTTDPSGGAAPSTGSGPVLPADTGSLEPPTGPAPVAVIRAGKGGVELLQPLAPTRPDAMENVELDTIGYSEDGDVQLSGRSRGFSTVRVYLNNEAVADLKADDRGRWKGQLNGIDPGIYTLRLDELGQEGNVLSRLETPFLREAPEVLNPPLRDPSPSQRALIRAVTVQKGDTLWAISRERYGRGVLYVRVYEANRQHIRDPDLIYPGQIFALPE